MRLVSSALLFLLLQLLEYSKDNYNFVYSFVVTTTPSKRTTSRKRYYDVAPPLAATTASTSEESSNSFMSDTSLVLADGILEQMKSTKNTAIEWGEMFSLPNDALFYSLFSSIRSVASLGLKGQPFVLRQEDISNALADDGDDNIGKQFDGYFTYKDLAKAVDDDFLDAARGSTDNRKGWKVTDVSRPRGNSFEESRMSLDDIEIALEKGTVIFNACGAHIPKLAGPSLACTDATALPCASNLYVTAPGKRTSAPPHTDKQDVVIIQTSGKKHWRVYSPPNPAIKPTADCFARGKGDDNLPLYALETELGCTLLLETTLHVGDVLFIPAAFPHTTDTVHGDDESADTSLHLTFNFDSHVWDLDYLSARRLALRRSCIPDSALGQSREEDNRYVGNCNSLPKSVRDDLFDALPLGLLDDMDENSKVLVDNAALELERISHDVDTETSSKVDQSVWRETIYRLQEHGMELFDIHRDMYLAAIEEGKTREAEDEMTAHLDKGTRQTMTPERMQRLSLFRVQKYYDKINESKKTLAEWSFSGKPSTTAVASGAKTTTALPENWAFTLPIKVGDQVEADLGGAFFPAQVTNVVGDGSSYDVQFFDGDKETGLERGMLKLLTPPEASTDDDDVDFSTMTKKQIKRWKKEQEKKKKK